MNCPHCGFEMEWILDVVRWYSEQGLQTDCYLCRRCGVVITPTPPLSGYIGHISVSANQIDEENMTWEEDEV